MSFHLVELAGVDNVLIVRRQHSANFFLRAADAVLVHGMTVKGAGYEVRVLALAGDPLKEIHKGLRIVSGRVFILDTQQVGLTFEIPAELHERHRHGETGDLANRHAYRPAYEYQRYRSHVPNLRTRRALGGVARGNMGNLVRHHPG